MYEEINKQKSKYETRIIISFVVIGIAFITYILLAKSMASSGPLAHSLLMLFLF